MAEKLTNEQQALMTNLGELSEGDHWLCFVNAGFKMADAKALWRLGLIEATTQMAMPTARLTPAGRAALAAQERD